MSDIEHLVSVRNEVGEGPLWHPEEKAIYWVDILGKCIQRFHPATDKLEVYDVGIEVGAVAMRAAGGFVLATRNGFAFWDRRSGDLDFIADPEADIPQNRFNDGAVDRQGRFWAGTLSDDDPNGPNGSLYRLDADGSVHTMGTGFTVSNGIGWSPDNSIMYFVDTMRHVIYAYDYDPATGAIENRRPFVRVPEEDGVPDGLTVDSEGFVWLAMSMGWEVRRYDPDGKAEREISVPTAFVSSCAFGGENLDELYITTGWSPLNAKEKENQPLAGDLFRIQTEVKGVAEPKYLG